MTQAMNEQAMTNAPIVDLLLTVSFGSAFQNLSILDIAEVQRLFRDEYPDFQQIPRAGPMSAQLQPEPTISLQIGAGPQAGVPRVAFQNLGTGGRIYFQEDRLSYGWMRTTPLNAGSNYPGFDHSMTMFERHLRTLRDWARTRGVDLTPAVGELSYTDAFAVNLPGGAAPSRVTDVFTFLNPSSMGVLYGFTFQWMEPLPEQAMGYVHATATGPVQTHEGVQVMTLETIAHLDASDGGWEGLREPFEAAHAAIHHLYERVVTPEARATS